MLSVMTPDALSRLTGVFIDNSVWDSFRDWVSERNLLVRTSLDWEEAWYDYENDYTQWNPSLALPLNSKVEVLTYLKRLRKKSGHWKVFQVPNADYQIIIIPKPKKEN